MTTILIVDDNAQNLYMLQVLLKGHGYEVFSATNGVDALRVGRQNLLDMVVSDILMPVMDGFVLCRQWKTDEHLKPIPFVFYTATYTEPADEDFAYSLGAERFIIKPQDPAVLIKQLREVLDEYRADKLTASHKEVEEPVFLKHHNDALFRKLEDKLAQLEITNLSLERDIAERKQVEEKLKKSVSLLLATLESTSDGILVVDNTGKCVSYNNRFLQMWNLSEGVLASFGDNYTLEYFTLGQLKEPESFTDKVKDLHRDAETTSLDVLELKDERTFERYSQPQRIDGQPVGRVWSFRDVTNQRRAETELQQYAVRLEQTVEERTSELRRAKEQIELILNHTHDAVALTQSNGDIQTRNPAFIAMFGTQVSQHIERVFRTVADDAVSVSVGHALMKVIYDQESQRIEAQIVSGDGHNKDIDLELIPVQLANGVERSGILVSAHDITHLKDIERFKTRFVNDVIHDLATPISALSTRLYMLKRFPENLNDHVRALENQVKHLSNLLADLRTLSQLDRAQLRLTLGLCDLNELMKYVFDTYEPVAVDKAQPITLSLDPSLPKIQLDSQQIERVLVNLISNAINYSPNGRAIYVQTETEAGNVVFSVTDEGIGISSDELPHVFERFYRTDRARQTQAGGTGLGLAIVKEIVELHGGTVSVRSEPGKGSTFKVQLPFRR